MWLQILLASLSALITSLIMNRNKILYVSNIEDKDVDTINKYIKKHEDYLRVYFWIPSWVGQEAYIMYRIDDKTYFKTRNHEILFGRSVDTNMNFENTYERICMKHFINLDSFLVVDEETEAMLTMICG